MQENESALIASESERRATANIPGHTDMHPIDIERQQIIFEREKSKLTKRIRKIDKIVRKRKKEESERITRESERASKFLRTARSKKRKKRKKRKTAKGRFVEIFKTGTETPLQAIRYSIRDAKKEKKYAQLYTEFIKKKGRTSIVGENQQDITKGITRFNNKGMPIFKPRTKKENKN